MGDPSELGLCSSLVVRTSHQLVHLPCKFLGIYGVRKFVRRVLRASLGRTQRVESREKREKGKKELKLKWKFRALETVPMTVLRVLVASRAETGALLARSEQ